MRSWFLPLVIALFLPLPAPSAGPASAPGSDGWVELTADETLGAWRGPVKGWVRADEVGLHPKDGRRLAARAGRGAILVTAPKRGGRASNLVTKEEFADVEVHLEFLVPRRSNSGVKLMGLYEVQILDSWGVKKPKGTDCGGIYPRAEDKPKYHYLDVGVPPRVNACRKAGEWQTLDVVFEAPRFEGGRKVAHAKFVRVALNGVVIHEGVEVKAPTGSAWRLKKEVARGPLLLQGDHGPVAFRHVRVRAHRPAGAASRGGKGVGR
jgi:hypothetical protein